MTQSTMTKPATSSTYNPYSDMDADKKKSDAATADSVSAEPVYKLVIDENVVEKISSMAAQKIDGIIDMKGVFYHTFLEYGPYAGEIGGRKNGAMIAMTTEKAVAYALGTLQERGSLFVEPGTECYEGMLVGERSQPGDMVVNIARTKNLGNQRSSTADISVQLVPPRTFSLEEALEYIIDDELVEVTPKNIRMRKRLLNATDRKKAANRAVK